MFHGEHSGFRHGARGGRGMLGAHSKGGTPWARQKTRPRACRCCRWSRSRLRRTRRARPLTIPRSRRWPSVFCRTVCCSRSACGAPAYINTSSSRGSGGCAPAAWPGLSAFRRSSSITRTANPPRWGCWKTCSARSWTRSTRRAASGRSSACGAAPRPRPRAAWG